MIEILAVFLEKLVTTLWASGPIGMFAATAVAGWGAALVVFLKSKIKVKKTEPTTIDYISEIRKLHDKYLISINELNHKYSESMMDLNEKRITDLKDLSKDYNQLASDTLATLDRLIEQLSPRKSESVLQSGDDINGK